MERVGFFLLVIQWYVAWFLKQVLINKQKTLNLFLLLDKNV